MLIRLRGFLEVFGGDFFEGEEAVAFGAEVDEGGFEAGFDASDAAFVDVGLLLLAGARLMSRSNRRWPSTSATRNSSGGVALISILFM